MTRLHAEIAGGGPAALTLGARLAQLGWSVRLHERSPAIRDEGSGIYIWENGLRVLEAIGAYDAAVDGAVAGAASMFSDRGAPPIRRIPPQTKARMRLFSIPRDRLLRAILDAATAAGAEVVLSSEAVAARPDGVLALADGTECAADLVVGADGVHSQVRDSLDLRRLYEEMSDGAIRAMIPRRPEDGDDVYVEHWNGSRRILVTPVSREQIYLALTCLDSDEEAKALPLRKDVWTESFPHLAGMIDRIGDKRALGPVHHGQAVALVVRPGRDPRRRRPRDGAEPGAGRRHGHAERPVAGHRAGCGHRRGGDPCRARSVGDARAPPDRTHPDLVVALQLPHHLA